MTTPAPRPEDEAKRLETLQRYALLDTAPEQSFDRIVRLAARQFDVPMALVSLVDENRQWFKAKCGLDADETDRDVAFCAHAILQNDVFVIPDALEDSRFRDNPLVVGGPEIRFYAGAPLTAADGQNVGTLCLIDDKPRPDLTQREKALLRDLAAIVVDEFEMRAVAGNVLTEVQTRMAAEERLAATEDQLRLFIEHAPVAIAMLDSDLAYLAASRRWREDYRLGDQQIVARSHHEVFPVAPESWRKSFELCLQGDARRCDEDAFERSDGSVEWLRWEMHPWRDSFGAVGGVLIFTDIITDRKAAADELERHRNFLSTVLESIQDGVVACDAEGRLSLFNKATRRLHGMDHRAIPPDQWSSHYDLYQANGETPMAMEQIPLFRALQGEVIEQAEMVIAPKDLPPRHIMARSQPLIGSKGVVLGAVATMHDVTRQKEIEQQFYQAQKMEAVGQLTGGLAHDFNNLLAVILGNLQLLQQALKQEPKWARRAEAAVNAAQRGADLTRRLLAFSRKQVLEATSVDVNELLSGMDDLLRRTLGEMIELELVLADDLWGVRIDRSQLEAAILNLSINARDAMEGEGRLTIESRNVELGDDYALRHSDVLPGEYALISVSDNGTGMSDEVQKKIFEPFFTTKEVGEGSGLGLSMVFGFLKQSRGHVKIYSELGHGTTINMYLPRDRQQASSDAREDCDAADEPDIGRERILVVEDNEDVRDITVAMLEDMGYDIVEAGDGPSALHVLETSKTPFDLLFTDIVMPGGMNGPALARAAKDAFPHLKILYTSGYAEAAVLREGEVRNGAELVSKPFRREDLAKKVRQVLDEPIEPARAEAV